MGNRTLAWQTLIIGVVIALVSLTAGVTGLGDPAIGPNQIGGTILGLVTVYVGLLLLRYSR